MPKAVGSVASVTAMIVAMAMVAAAAAASTTSAERLASASSMERATILTAPRSTKARTGASASASATTVRTTVTTRGIYNGSSIQIHIPVAPILLGNVGRVATRILARLARRVH